MMNDVNRMPRTREAMIFEAVAVVMVLIIWSVSIVVYNAAGGSAGTPPGWVPADAASAGNGVVFLMAGLGTFLVGLMLGSAYYPKTMVNMPFAMKNVRQLVEASRLCRVLALLMAVMAVILELTILYEWMPMVLNVWVVLIVGVAFAWSFYIRKLR